MRALLLSVFGLMVVTGCSASSDANSGAQGTAGAGAAAGSGAGGGAQGARQAAQAMRARPARATRRAAARQVAARPAATPRAAARAALRQRAARQAAARAASAWAVPARAARRAWCCVMISSRMALGALPMGAPWAASNCFDSSHVLKVDGAQAKSGTHSLVSQGIPYADCQLHADLGTLTDFYVRANVYYAAGAADQFEAHEVSVFELVPAASTDDPSIRVGFRGNTCMPEGVEVNISGGMEQTGCTGKTPVAGVWTCYELHVKASDTGITADLSIDGVDQSYTNHGSPQMQLLNPELKSVRYLRLGSRSYSGSYTPLIYVDDIAVGTQPIGCGAPK